MSFAAQALLLFLALPLSQRPIWELNDSQICEAAHQMSQLPSSKVPGNSLVEIGEWEVECEPRVLRLPLTVLDPRADNSIVEAFARPEFCQASNLVAFWNRGWHLELQFRFTDGTSALKRPCEYARSKATTP